MRDLHYDADFMSHFNEATKKWNWASWHQMQAQHDATAERLLAEVFGATEPQGIILPDGEGQPEE